MPPQWGGYGTVGCHGHGVDEVVFFSMVALLGGLRARFSASVGGACDARA